MGLDLSNQHDVFSADGLCRRRPATTDVVAGRDGHAARVVGVQLLRRWQDEQLQSASWRLVGPAHADRFIRTELHIKHPSARKPCVVDHLGVVGLDWHGGARGGEPPCAMSYVGMLHPQRRCEEEHYIFWRLGHYYPLRNVQGASGCAVSV